MEKITVDLYQQVSYLMSVILFYFFTVNYLPDRWKPGNDVSLLDKCAVEAVMISAALWNHTVKSVAASDYETESEHWSDGSKEGKYGKCPGNIGTEQ